MTRRKEGVSMVIIGRRPKTGKPERFVPERWDVEQVLENTRMSLDDLLNVGVSKTLITALKRGNGITKAQWHLFVAACEGRWPRN